MKKYFSTALFFLYALFSIFFVFSTDASAFSSYTFDLDSSFPNKPDGDYATVEFEETDDGEIKITITNGPGLGDSDKLMLDRFYFNTSKEIDSLKSDSFFMKYDFGNSKGKFKPDGAGYFDGVIFFKNNKKKESLASVSFILSSLSNDLTIEDFLYESEDGRHGSYLVAAHWKHSDVKFAGCQVPIPGAVWLLGSGLIGVAGLRKRF